MEKEESEEDLGARPALARSSPFPFSTSPGRVIEREREKERAFGEIRREGGRKEPRKTGESVT